MARDKEKWFYPYDFMDINLGQFYVGYKAPTRLNELEKDYPKLFQSKKEGKYKVRKLNPRKYEWFDELDKDLQQIVNDNYEYYRAVHVELDL